MGVTQAGMLEHATFIPNPRSGGGGYDPENEGYPWRIVLHTVEGSASPGMIATHAYPPHLWYDPPTRRLYQTIPLGRSAFALYQAPTAPYYTNRARALQVEINGRAAETANWPIQWLNNITEDVVVPMCQWTSQWMGAQINLLNAPDPGPIPGSASAYAQQRLEPRVWAFNSGLYSHRHVPMGDDHWDTGGLDTPRIARHAAMLIAGKLIEIPNKPGGTDVAEAPFVKRDTPFDDPGFTAPGGEEAWDHFYLPAGAKIFVAVTREASSFVCVLYGPDFDRNATTEVVKETRWGQPAMYTTKKSGQHSVVIEPNMPVRIWAVY